MVVSNTGEMKAVDCSAESIAWRITRIASVSAGRLSGLETLVAAIRTAAGGTSYDAMAAQRILFEAIRYLDEAQQDQLAITEASAQAHRNKQDQDRNRACRSNLELLDLAEALNDSIGYSLEAVGRATRRWQLEISL